MRAGEAGSQWLQRDLEDISRDFNAWPLFGCWLKQTLKIMYSIMRQWGKCLR